MSKLYTVCVNSECKQPLTDFELEKQKIHPKTLKYKLCMPCKKKGQRIVLCCERCGVLSINIIEKYCDECALIIKKEQQHSRYIRLNPRGKCIVCDLQLVPEVHGRCTKYCSNRCRLINRRRRNKTWESYKSEKAKAKRRAYQRLYYYKNRETIKRRLKLYRNTDEYREKALKYYYKKMEKLN